MIGPAPAWLHDRFLVKVQEELKEGGDVSDMDPFDGGVVQIVRVSRAGVSNGKVMSPMIRIDSRRSARCARARTVSELQLGRGAGQDGTYVGAGLGPAARGAGAVRPGSGGALPGAAEQKGAGALVAHLLRRRALHAAQPPGALPCAARKRPAAHVAGRRRAVLRPADGPRSARRRCSSSGGERLAGRASDADPLRPRVRVRRVGERAAVLARGARAPALDARAAPADQGAAAPPRPPAAVPRPARAGGARRVRGAGRAPAPAARGRRRRGAGTGRLRHTGPAPPSRRGRRSFAQQREPDQQQ